MLSHLLTVIKAWNSCPTFGTSYSLIGDCALLNFTGKSVGINVILVMNTLLIASYLEHTVVFITCHNFLGDLNFLEEL